jgi:release factor glutamine methyltransferase
MTVRELLGRAGEYLATEGVDSPQLSAQILVAHGLGMERIELLLTPGREVAAREEGLIWELVRRRGRGESAAAIVGCKEFYGLEFKVTGDVLVPRPETELLMETAEARFPGACKGEPLRFADLGTGSGCLAVTAAVRFSAAVGIALDVSARALEVAQGNGAAHSVESRLLFAQGNFAAAGCRSGEFDLVFSNPPYVSAREFEGLSREVRCFEPRGALVPEGKGESGLEAIEVLVPEAWRMLRNGGVLLMEIGAGQGQAALELVRRPGECSEVCSGTWSEVTLLPDLAGLDRAIVATAQKE